MKNKDELLSKAATWVAEDAAKLLSSPKALEPLIEVVVDAALDGTQAEVETDITPWDHSTRGHKTNKPFNLAQYETIEDFLEEPTGETVATFVSGSGFCAETWRDVIKEEALSIVMDAIRNAAKKALETAPDDIREWLGQLDEMAFDDFVGDDCYESLLMLDKPVMEYDLEERLAKLPFRETILQRCPEARTRIKDDLRCAKAKKEVMRDVKVPDLYPVARRCQRHWVFYAGPTNSGKTHQALSHLMTADSGIYLAPLRLLALEVYERLIEAGRRASMVTGEHKIVDPDAKLTAATIEMAPLSGDLDVAVIDEVQMIADRDRGHAWTTAILGVPARKVIMAGSIDAIPAIRTLAEKAVVMLDIVETQRKGRLAVMNQPVEFPKGLEPGDALIAFSRREVLALRSELLQAGYSVAVVYGALTPETRREESRRFREGEAEILVATDAIGMGLNLPIRRVIFYTVHKWDGTKNRLLSPAEIQQIAGRAGRFGLHETGWVGSVREADMPIIERAIQSRLTGIRAPYPVAPSWLHVASLAKHLDTDSLPEIILHFRDAIQGDSVFKGADLDTMLYLAQWLDGSDLSLHDHQSDAPASSAACYGGRWI